VLARLEARVFLELLLDCPRTVHLQKNSMEWQTRVQMRGPGALALKVGKSPRALDTQPVRKSS